MNAFTKCVALDCPNSNANKFLFLRSRSLGESGLVCMAMMFNCHGHAIKLKALRRRHPHFRRGMNVKHMIELFNSYGLRARALQCETERLIELNTPCIAHWDWRRFVVFQAIGEDLVSVADPTLMVEQLNFAQLGWHYSGTVVEICTVGETNG